MHPEDPGQDILLLGGTAGGGWFTYVELETSWDALVAASPIDLWDGQPSPARVLLGAQEVDEVVELTGPSSSGVRLGGLPYSEFEARGQSPLALPFRAPDGAVDLSGSTGRLRALVPAPDWRVGEFVTFAELALEPLHALSLELQAFTPISGATFTLTRRSDRVGDLIGNVSRSLRLEESHWQLAGSIFVARWDAGLVPSGDYVAALLGFGEGAGVQFEPPMVPVDGATEAQLWIETETPAAPSECVVRVRFSEALETLFQRHDIELLLTIASRSSGQWRGGPPIAAFRIDASTTVQEDRSVVQLERRHRFAEGVYDIQIEPIGFTATLEIAAGAHQATIDVPPIAAVVVREMGRDEGPSADIRLRPAGYKPRVGVNAATDEITHDGFERQFALVHGEYEFVPDANGFVDPARFTVAAAEQVVEYIRRPRSQRRVTFTIGGEAARLPLSALASAKLVRDGGPVEDAVVSAAGYQGAFGTLSGLDLTFREPGIYDLLWRLEVPGVGSREGVVEAFEASPSMLPPILVALDG
ncbi:MAG: hypothetical protein GC161_05065 [Planctomycetaceae bacterium]|nr:hypothetical protein [Planctomycetaceae bacterium]